MLNLCIIFASASGGLLSAANHEELTPHSAGFDLVWFGVVMSIVMEMGLIHPPVGLNIFVIKNIAPDIPLSDIIWGTMPFVILMFLAVLLCCFVPGIATWLPSIVMK